MNEDKVFFKRWASPVGNLNLYADEINLLALTYAGNDEEVVQRLGLTERIEGYSFIIEETIRQLEEYFSGQRKTFELPLEMSGTDFQIKAWSHLPKIPIGSVLSYRQHAEVIDALNAVRAVGSANAKNPFAIILPCHRVLGSNGKISGYSGGPEIKRRLLELEGYRFSDIEGRRTPRRTKKEEEHDNVEMADDEGTKRGFIRRLAMNLKVWR